jgi:hypothetical protein
MLDDRTTPLFTFHFEETDPLPQLLTRLFDPLQKEDTRALLFRPDEIQRIVQRAGSWYVNKIRLNKLTTDHIISCMVQMGVGRIEENSLVLVNPSTTLWMSNLMRT